MRPNTPHKLLDFPIGFVSVKRGASGVRMPFSRLSFWNKSANLLAFLLLGSLCGCGDEAPPYEALQLRDALRAAPEVVATLAEDSRHELAVRLQDAEKVDPETLTFMPEALRLDELVASADAVRETSGKDALLFGEILATEGHGLIEIHSLAENNDDDGEPLALSGKASDVAAPFEEAALHGQAGKTLRVFAERTHARELVRMTGLPVAAVAWNDKVYVNESWLVAMSALENECAAPPAPQIPSGMGTMPTPAPLSVEFSPYDLPDNLAACTAQVQKTCACTATSSCTHERTDKTFSDATAECNWVNQDPANASALCIMALTVVDPLVECMKKASPPCFLLTVTNRDDGVDFAANAQCVTILDACLGSGHAPGEPAEKSCAESCRYCDGKNNDCLEFIEDCGTSAEACQLCIEICALCAQSADRKSPAEAPFKYAAIRPVSQCSVRPPAAGKSPLPAPTGTALWLLAPIAFVLGRSRRRM